MAGMSADSPITILVADDEEEILELLGEYLRARGHTVYTAADGQAALDILRSTAVDVVLTDSRMPGLGGVELLAEVKHLSQPVACVVMTGFGTVEAAIRAMKEGAYDFILKPFKLREVHASLVRAHERLRGERELSRTRELVAFYEFAHGMEDEGSVPRLFGMLAGVLLRETGGTEVAVWMETDVGWQAVARGGGIAALAGFDAEDVLEPVQIDDVAAAPLRRHERRVGAVAVAGVPADQPDALKRIALFARVVGDTLGRVTKRPAGL